MTPPKRSRKAAAAAVSSSSDTDGGASSVPPPQPSGSGGSAAARKLTTGAPVRNQVLWDYFEKDPNFVKKAKGEFAKVDQHNCFICLFLIAHVHLPLLTP